MFQYIFASYCLLCHKMPCQCMCCGATSGGVISSPGLYPLESLDTSPVKPHSARISAASVSDMDCLLASHCGWADRIVTCTDFMVLSAHFEHWLYCRLVNELFYYFKTRDIVEMFRIFYYKNCRLIEITAEYCKKIIILHFCNVVQRHLVGQVKIIQCQVCW